MMDEQRDCNQMINVYFNAQTGIKTVEFLSQWGSRIHKTHWRLFYIMHIAVQSLIDPPNHFQFWVFPLDHHCWPEELHQLLLAVEFSCLAFHHFVGIFLLTDRKHCDKLEAGICHHKNPMMPEEARAIFFAWFTIFSVLLSFATVFTVCKVFLLLSFIAVFTFSAGLLSCFTVLTGILYFSGQSIQGRPFDCRIAQCCIFVHGFGSLPLPGIRLELVPMLFEVISAVCRGGPLVLVRHPKINNNISSSLAKKVKWHCEYFLVKEKTSNCLDPSFQAIYS